MKRITTTKFRSAESERGFTLVEVMIVAAITGMITTFLLLNFSNTRRNLESVTNQVMGHIRKVQAMATSSKQYAGTYRCGYGIVPSSATRYNIYAGPVSSASCVTENRNYDGSDTIDSVEFPAFVLPDANIEFKEQSPGVYFSNIFFEPPDPKTYINNTALLSTAPARITIGLKGKDCSNPKDCRAICIFTSGAIDVQRDLTCP